jgi:RNA recognition motif-containing protein
MLSQPEILVFFFVWNKIFFFTKHKILGELFEQISPVTNATIISKNGRSWGYGFVVFDSEVAAGEAIQKLNGNFSLGRPIKV